MEEIERMNEKHREIVAQEEKKRKQLVEHYQVRLILEGFYSFNLSLFRYRMCTPGTISLERPDANRHDQNSRVRYPR